MTRRRRAGSVRFDDRASVCGPCGRRYTPEPIDNGACCICNRDARWADRLGPTWRDILRGILGHIGAVS